MQLLNGNYERLQKHKNALILEKEENDIML
jgi:hypothetical protein